MDRGPERLPQSSWLRDWVVLLRGCYDLFLRSRTMNLITGHTANRRLLSE